MPDGIYAAAAGMAAQQTRLDYLANDIANTNTTGYQSQRVAFRDLLYSPEQGVPVGSGAAVSSLGPTQDPGTIQPDSNPLSLALNGPGYFQVRRADGTVALTRNGSFGLDANGDIVTATGQRLDPPIRVPKGTQPSDVSVSAQGAVSVGGKTIGKIAVVDVPTTAGLVPDGNDLFVPNAVSGKPAPITTTSIQQGALESSNVDLAQTMSDMIDAQRSYELTSRAITTQDQLLDDANQLVK